MKTAQKQFSKNENGEIPEGWEDVVFAEMAELIKDGYKPTGNDDFSYIGLEHIDQQSLSLNSIGHSTEVESNKFAFQSGDILFGKLRPYFRKVYRPRFSGVCSTDIWVVRAKEGMDQGFLFYFMANQDFVDLASSGSSGTRMPRADWNHLKDTLWNIPPIGEQRAIIISGPQLGESVIGGPVVSAQVAQSFAFIKSLAGVLCEAYECVQFGYHADNRLAFKCRGFKKYQARNKFIKKHNMVDLDSVYEPLMSKDTKNAQKALDNYFSRRKNLLRWLRNKYAFHYDFQEAMRNIKKFKEIDDPHIFLEETSANCCYVSANQWLILRALQVNADEKKLKTKFDKLMEEAVKQAKNMADFFHGFILAYSEKYLNVDMKSKESTLDNVMFIDEIKFPFFSKRRQT